MASGTIWGSFGGTSTSDVRPCIEWSSTTNVSNNSSSVTAKLVFIKYSSYWYPWNANGHTVTLSINGNSSSSDRAFDLRNRNRQVIWERTVTVPHNSDGSKSTTISASGNTGLNLGSYSISETVNLGTIPRASSMSQNKTSMNFGDTVTFSISRASSSFTHTINYNIEGTGGNVVSKTTGTSVNWTPPLSLATKIPRSTSTKVTVYLDTYSGNTKIGVKTYSITLNVPSSVKPTVNAIGHTEQDGTVNTLGLTATQYLQGKSKVRLTCSWSMQQGATVSSVTWGLGGARATGTGAPTFNLSSYATYKGNQTIFCEVKDSRGRSTKVTATINVLAYSPPKINSFSVNRTTGTNIRIDKSCSFSAVGNNTLTYEITRSGGASGSVGTITHATNSYTYSGYDVTKSYDFLLRITDKLNSTTAVDNISTTRVLFDMNKDIGIGIGKMNEGRGSLELGGTTYLEGDLIIESTGIIKSAKNSYASSANGSAIDMRNSDIANLNAIWFGYGENNPDPANADSEGIQFAKPNFNLREDGKVNWATDRAGWDNLRVYDGRLVLNDAIVGTDKVDTELWSGALYMSSSQTVTPSVPIRWCPNGWCLVWSDYNSSTNTAGNYDWAYTFVHKQHTYYANGTGVHFVIGASVNSGGVNDLISKYCYINTTTITGNNSNEGTSLDKNVVLRKVLVW